MNWNDKIRKITREPLFHFLIIGLAVFVFTSITGSNIDLDSRKITVNAKQIERLSQNWQNTWQRLPNQSELDGLIREDIKDEIYYREAIRLGLDQNDIVIRRRLRSKMEYLAISQAESEIPSDEILQAWIDKNPQKYSIGAKYSFDQIYLESDSETNAQARVAAALQKLRAGSDWRTLGDAISLPTSLNNVTKDEIGKTFGDGFSIGFANMKIGEWSGPIESGFGLHIVRINSVLAGSKPKLDDVRTDAQNDWRSQTVKEREQKAYQTLLDAYTIKIDKPK